MYAVRIGPLELYLYKKCSSTHSFHVGLGYMFPDRKLICSSAFYRFTNKKVPYCVKFNPDEDKQDLFVAGTADKKIICVGISIVDNLIQSCGWI